jgi:hypothetical protein
MLKVDLLGTKELRAAIEKAEKKLVEGVNRAMDASTIAIHNKQVSGSPQGVGVDKGRLRAGNTFDNSKPLNKFLENKIEYAPYQEFGTGAYVFMGETWMTPELLTVASAFKGQGIRKVNMKPQPFFYRPFYEEVPKLIKAIEEVLK